MFLSISFDTKKFTGLLANYLELCPSDTHPVANLAHLFAFYGASLGAYPHALWGDKIYPNLNALITGDTNSGKGTSLNFVRNIFDPQDKDLVAPFRYVTFSSGKNFVEYLDNTLTEISASSSSLGQTETRFLQLNEEVASQLSNMRIPANSLMDHMNALYDGREISERLGKRSISLKDIHFAGIYHTTPASIRSKLDKSLVEQGYGNRLLIVGLPKSPYTRNHNHCDQAVFNMLQDKIMNSLRVGGERTQIDLTDDAESRFIEFEEKYYQPDFGNERVNLLIARFAKQCLKLALIIALINQEEKISLESMMAACEFMEYSRACIEKIFGNNQELQPKYVILNYVREKGEVTKTDITREFYSRWDISKLNATIEALLLEEKLISTEIKKERGRKAITYSLHV